MTVQVVEDFSYRISGAVLCKDGFNIIFVKTQQHGPEYDQHGVEKGAAVFCVAEIFDIEIFQHVMDLCIIIHCERSDNFPRSCGTAHGQLLLTVTKAHEYPGKYFLYNISILLAMKCF